MCLAHPVSDTNLWLILLRCVPMIPKRMCQVHPPRLTFWMTIVVIYWFAAFGWNRLIPLLTFVWRILLANLIRICHPRRPWNDTRKRRKNIANPARTNVTLRGIDGRNVWLCSPNISQEACKVTCRRMGVADLHKAWMSIALVRAMNRCIRGSRIPVRNMSNRFRWEGGTGIGLLKSDN